MGELRRLGFTDGVPKEVCSNAAKLETNMAAAMAELTLLLIQPGSTS